MLLLNYTPKAHVEGRSLQQTTNSRYVWNATSNTTSNPQTLQGGVIDGRTSPRPFDRRVPFVVLSFDQC